MRPRLAWIFSSLLGAFSLVPAARTQTFDVKGLHVEKGATEVASDNAFFSGGRSRSAHEQIVHYGLRDWWRLTAAVEWDNPIGGDIQATHAAVESIFVLRPMTDGSLGLGLFAALEGSLHRSSTNAFVIGPIVAARWGRLTTTINPFFEETFGRNREEGIALTYGLQTKYEVGGGFSIGAEGYGLVENLGDTPRLADQQHRVGPVLFQEVSLREGAKMEPSFGILFGLTPATPDVTFRLNVDFHFH